MSSQREHFWQYGIRCDYPGCLATIWRTGLSEQLAFTAVQSEARRAGWSVARDRGVASRDMCVEHAR